MNKVSGSTTVKYFFFFSFLLLFFFPFFPPVAHLVRNLLTRLDVSWDFFFSTLNNFKGVLTPTSARQCST